MFLRIVTCIILACHVANSSAQLPAGFRDDIVIPGIVGPIAMAYAPDGRLFILERAGGIRVYKNGVLLPTKFATINVRTNNERGLLGIAFDPNFAANQFVYIYYTTTTTSLNPPATPKNRVSRLTANGDVAAANSETIILDNIPSETGFHNGGSIHFGLDGKLYIAVGESGDSTLAQRLDTLAGKMLRINSDGSVPSDNPFVGQGGVLPEIYQYGLRNPFRFRFRPGTNVAYIADVGEGTREEISVGPAGANFGWEVWEGTSLHRGPDPGGTTFPIFEYDHNGSGASITGGCFIENHTWPSIYQGNYFYGDFIDQFVARMVVTPQNTFVSNHSFGPATRPVDFIQGLDGDLWYCDISGDRVRRIWYSGGAAGFTITTDKTAGNGGDPIQINWTVPAGRPSSDWVGIFKVGDPNTAARWSQSTGGTAAGSLNASLPNETGTFEVRYLDASNTVLGRSTHIQVTGVEAPFSLTPSATSLEAGKPLSISWTAPSGRPTTDWIALYRVGDPNQSYGWWRYTGGATSGTFFLTAPMTAGQYEFRYLVNNGFTDVVRSATITVTAPAGYSLSANPSAVNPGGSVAATWTAPAGSSAVDWIGLYRVGDDPRQYIAWTYTNGATSGTWNVMMPSTPGQYEFRYLLNNGYDQVRATSNTVTVSTGYSLSANPATVGPAGSVTVSWTAPPGSAARDWVALYRVGADNRQYIYWRYTNGATSGTWTLNMPIQTGQYEFRYLLNDGYDDVRATSNTVTVQ